MTAILEPDTVAVPSSAPGPAPAPVSGIGTAPAPAPVRVSGVGTAPAPVAAPARAPRRPGRLRTLLATRPRLTRAGVRWIAAAFFLLELGVELIQPAPDGPLPDPTGWLAVLVNVHGVLLFTALGGLALGRRWALWPATGYAALLGVNIALCPLSGHHLVAGWWFGQIALGAAMLALPVVALWRTRPAR